MKFVQPYWQHRSLTQYKTRYQIMKKFKLKYAISSRFSLIILAFTFSFISNGQISVTNNLTPNQLVQNVLLGFGVTATNITVNGSPLNASSQLGNATYFSAGTTSFPIPSGVLLSTGNGIAAVGPNNSGSFTNNNPATAMVGSDPHLNAIANGTVNNGIVLEFDFVPAGDTISFNYMFGSDEYPEFSPSSYNDAFGFFLWGPGVSGPYVLAGYPAGGTNLAIVPGTTTPVTINNVGPGSNATYYQNNLGGAAYGSAIQYDGITTLLSANASIQCGQTYHIKLCIANVGDQSYDSGVFLQANSFSSEAIEISVTSVTGDTSIYEGCSNANLLFIRPQTQLDDTLVISYVISGTATMGVDYNNLINPITFLPGEDTIALNINPISDGIPDNLEYVTITATTISSCGDTLVSTGTLYILDEIPITINESNPTVLCQNDSVLVTAVASGLFPPFTYNWTGGQIGDTAYFPTIMGAMTGSVDYYVTATNSCGYSNIDTVTITLNQTLAIDTIWSGPATCEPIGWVSAFIQGQTTTPQQGVFYTWNGPGASNPSFVNASVWDNLSSGWYYIQVKDAVCTVNDSIFIDILNAPNAEFSSNTISGCSPLEVNFTNTSENGINYLWDFGNGQTNNVTTTASQTQTFTSTSLVQLIVQQGNCADTATAVITISICGCTDNTAVNYNPLATVDDGSCIYPIPSASAPNVFTPNDDSSNDLFFITAKNYETIELIILNRWGNIVYSSQGVNPAWDGKTPSGAEALEGTYFYRYTVFGLQNQTVEGSGFLQLVRN